MNKILEQLGEYGIVPVVVLNRVEDAKPLAKALCDGGCKCAEVTFRTDAAEESIKIMSEEYPEMLVGAGTVLTIDQVDRAVNAGAKFIVDDGAAAVSPHPTTVVTLISVANNKTTILFFIIRILPGDFLGFSVF